MNPDDYSVDAFEFVVFPSNYYLLPEDDRDSFLLEIKDQDEASKQMFSGVWGRLGLAYKTYLKHNGVQQAPIWTGWDFSKFAGEKDPGDRIKFAAWLGDSVVGVLNVRPNYLSIDDPDSKVLYVEHIATEPGSLRTPIWGRSYRSIGTALMAYAILQSVHHNARGRIGFHATDAEAKRFYDQLNERHSLFAEPRKDVSGTPQDRNARAKFYYESIPEPSLEFLNGYRHG